MKLSEHFTLEEMTASATAKRLGIMNKVPEGDVDNPVIANMRNLCEKVLEPLREWYGGPIRISSGYRCPALNKAVGGVRNSQHITGEAADIRPLSYLPKGETIKLQTGNEGGLSSTNVQTGNEGGLSSTNVQTGNDVALSSTNVSNSSPLGGDKRGVLLSWYRWMAIHLHFDQLILERKSKDSNNWWIHVSLCRDDSKNRQQCFMTWT